MAKLVSELGEDKVFECLASADKGRRMIIFHTYILAHNTELAHDKLIETLKMEYSSILPDLWEVEIRHSVMIA